MNFHCVFVRVSLSFSLSAALCWWLAEVPMQGLLRHNRMLILSQSSAVTAEKEKQSNDDDHERNNSFMPKIVFIYQWHYSWAKHSAPHKVIQRGEEGFLIKMFSLSLFSCRRC